MEAISKSDNQVLRSERKYLIFLRQKKLLGMGKATESKKLSFNC